MLCSAYKKAEKRKDLAVKQGLMKIKIIKVQ